MPGPDSLLHPQSSRPTYRPGTGLRGFIQARQQQPPPMAAPGLLDVPLGRGNYAQEFSKRRDRIMDASLIEKRRLRRDMRMRRRRYELKLRKDNKKLYQQFDIRMSQRADKDNLSEREQKKARKMTWLKINEDLREEERKAEHQIERNATKEIKTMRDSLRDEVYSVAP